MARIYLTANNEKGEAGLRAMLVDDKVLSLKDKVVLMKIKKPMVTIESEKPFTLLYRHREYDKIDLKNISYSWASQLQLSIYSQMVELLEKNNVKEDDVEIKVV